MCLVGRERNPNDEKDLPVGDDAKDYLEILRKTPTDCTDDEKKKFLLFVEIGASALNRHLSDRLEVKRAFLRLTESDISWAVTNFKYYARKDEPEEDGGKKTPKGNDSKRQFKRQKVAGTKEIQDKIALDYYDIKTELMEWNRGLDIANESERKGEIAKREATRHAWADFLHADRNSGAVRERVAPSNGGAKTNPFKRIKVELSSIPGLENCVGV